MAMMIRAILVAAALMLCAAPSIAGPPDIFAPTGRLPADVDLVVVVDGAGAHRASEVGRALRGIADVLLAGGETLAAWQRLSARLGMTEDQAFDALLGARVVIVCRGLWGPAPVWAMLSEVDRPTQEALVKRLPNAPRGIVAGHPISSVEDGKFELTIERRKSGATILVAPAKSSALFDELVPLLRHAPTAPLRATPAIQEMTAALKADIEAHADALLYLRLPPETGGWAAVLARRSGRDVIARFSSRPEVVIGEVKPWSLGHWAAMSEGSLLCIMERRPHMPENGADLPATVLADLPWLAPEPEIEAVLGERHGLALHAGANGGVVATIAVETTPDAGAAVQGDVMMRNFAIRLSQRLHQGAWSYDFGGAFPEALRVVKLTEPGGPQLPFLRSDAEKPADDAWGVPAGLDLAWTYRFERDCEDSTGWLAAGASPARVEAIADKMACARGRAVEGSWLSVGQAEPANLLKALRSSGDPLPGAADALGWVEFLGWRVELAEAGGVRGAMKMRFATGQ